jgi:membrane protease YdiL (CAAX protease family)
MTTLQQRPVGATQQQVPTGPTAGWYADPAGCHQFRYWNGRTWTPGVADSGFVREDPLPEQPCAPLDERARPPLRAAAIGLAGLVLGFLLAAAVALAFHIWAPEHKAWALGVSQAGLWTGMISALVLVSRRYGTGSIRRDFGLRARPVDLAWGLLIAFVARIVVGVVTILVLLAAGRLHTEGSSSGLGAARLDGARLVLMCLFLVVGAPLIEEVFFRGLLLRSLQTRLTIWVAVPVQAVLFSAAHSLSSTGLGLIAQLIGTLLFGLAAGIIVHHFRRLGPTMVGHALFNLVPALVLISISV